MKQLVITWPTVALAAVLCSFVVALAKFAPPEWFAAGGIVAVVAGAMLRQAAYTKTNGTIPPPPPPVQP